MKRAFVMAGAFGIFVVALGWAAVSSNNKDVYLKKAEADVQAWTSKLKSLQERSEKNGAKTRQELDQQLKVVDEKLAVARQKLEDLKVSNEGNWKSFRKGLDEALGDVKSAYRKAQTFFNKNETKEKS